MSGDNDQPIIYMNSKPRWEKLSKLKSPVKIHLGNFSKDICFPSPNVQKATVFEKVERGE